ncbi:helix-turn-helix transcriptional regulator [Dongia sp.]|uniref:helix-turn-helix transcriptional regulator n=1 Tax=Dongia sp. TaxID=1977262 RepID=UPI0035B49C33
MSRSDRLFDLIQRLRAAKKPLRAADLARSLEVTERTIYRDMAALQSMRVPVEGAAGIGYVMRSGFDLPPVNFDAEEVEAILVGLSLLARTGDKALLKAAGRVGSKLGTVLPPDRSKLLDGRHLQVSRWGVATDIKLDMGQLRQAIREERKLGIRYVDERGRRSTRKLRPIGIIYWIEVVVLVAWCEKRRALRHFRLDRIEACRLLKEDFRGQGDGLRAKWQAEAADLAAR